MRFDFCNPTRMVFGRGVLARAGDEIAGIGKRALIVTGGSSAKRQGTLDRLIEACTLAAVRTTVFGGIEPNPRLSTIRAAGRVAVDEAVDVVVALGGGSAMDASKVIAALPAFEGEPWDMFDHGQSVVRWPEQALPIVTIPTLAATGSEMNATAVVTNEVTSEKTYTWGECLYPRLALVDPELTLTVPANQTAYGVTDLITHVTETYFNGVDNTPLQDRMCEGIILTALEFGPRAVANGADIEARTQIQYASIMALNGVVQAGCNPAFPVHGIEHVLSALHDIAHGAGLAILSPAWMRFAATHEPRKYESFAQRVFGVASAQQGIDRLREFFASLGCPTRLSDAGIPASDIERIARDAIRVNGHGQGRIAGRPPLSEADVVAILRMCA